MTDNEALGKANDVGGLELDVAKVGADAMLNQSVRVANKAAAEGNLMTAVDGVITAGRVSSVLDGLGAATGVLDAGLAINDAYEAWNNPNATGMQKAGAITKAAFKTAMVFIKANPIISIAFGIADLTGATDAIFDWK